MKKKEPFKKRKKEGCKDARRVGCIFIGQVLIASPSGFILPYNNTSCRTVTVGRYFDDLAWRRCKFRGLRWVFFAGFVVRGGFCWHVVRILCLCSVLLFTYYILDEVTVWMVLWGETSERRGADFLFPFHRLLRCWHETVLMDGGLGRLWMWP